MPGKTLVSIAAILAVGIVATRQAAAQSNPGRDLTASCVTADSFQVVLLRPQRALARWGAGDSQSLFSPIAGRVGEKLGFDLHSIRQVAFIMYNDAPPDAAGLNHFEHTGLAAVFELSEPAEAADVVSRFATQYRGWRRLGGNAVAAEYRGQRYYKCGYETEGSFGGDEDQPSDECLWFLDDRTFLFASEHWLHKIFDARETAVEPRLAAWVEGADVVVTLSDINFLTSYMLVSKIGSRANSTFQKVAEELEQSESTFEDVPNTVSQPEPPQH